MSDWQHTKLIVAELARYLSMPADQALFGREVQSLARREQLLPIYRDWTGFIGINSEGRLFFVDTEEQSSPKVLDSPAFAHVALAQSRVHFPALAPLVPRRAADSRDCPSCGGTGQVVIGGHAIAENVVCACGGLGWLPANVAASTERT